MNVVLRIRKSLYTITLNVFLTAFALLFLTQCVSFRKTDQEITEYFQGSPVKPTFHSVRADSNRIIHYATIGADSLPLVIFVHGSPGSWTAFIDYFQDSTLYNRARLISVDRLGFGRSGLGQVEASMHRQAQAITTIIKATGANSKAILVGHSLGGPVIARLAMDFPDLVHGLIMVAGSIDPDLEKKEWFRPIIGSSPIRYIIPVDLDVSNREIRPLKGELIRMVPEMNHFIPWRRPDLIRSAILEQLQKANSMEIR